MGKQQFNASADIFEPFEDWHDVHAIKEQDEIRNEIANYIIETSQDSDQSEVCRSVMGYNIKYTKARFTYDACDIIKRTFSEISAKAKRNGGDVEADTRHYAVAILAAIAVEIAGWTVMTAMQSLQKNKFSADVRAAMKTRLAVRRPSENDVAEGGSWLEASESRQVTQSAAVYDQLAQLRGEITSERRRLSDLRSEIDGMSTDAAAANRKANSEIKILEEIKNSQKENFIEINDEFKSRMDKISEKWNFEFQQNTMKTRELFAEFEAKNAENLARIDNYINAATEAQDRVDGLNGSLARTEENLEAFKKAAQERAGQAESRQHWSRRIVVNSIGFATSAFIVAVLLIAVPIFGFFHLQSILEFMKTVSDAINNELGPTPNAAQITMATVNRLVVIGAPVALYFWLVRIILRYNTITMTLMDDAHQRRTMIDTYIHLVEHNIAKPEDRAILLNAIFRPAPGQANDVEPPSFVDLLEKLKPGAS
jgi:predicted  nucleic acid-binding Zn-ribbon protein